LQERFGDAVFQTVIRASIAYAESRAGPLDPRPPAGPRADYIALADEVLAVCRARAARRRLAELV